MSNPPEDSLRAAVEADEAVRHLIEALSLADGALFALVVIESAAVTRELVDVLQSRCATGASWHDPHNDQQDRHKPTDPKWLLPRVLGPLMDAPPSSRAVWVLDATSSLPHDHDAWAEVFRGLNELRNEITQRLKRPLVLCIPGRMEQLFARNAPDVFSVRASRFGVHVTPPAVIAGNPLREGTATASARPRGPVDPSSAFASDEEREAREMMPKNPRGALQRAEEALRVRRSVAALGTDGPSRLEDELVLADSLVLAGDARNACGKHVEALAAFGEAIALFDAARARDPARAEHARVLAEVHERVGALEGERGNTEGARVALAHAVDLRRSLAQQVGDDVAARRGLERALRAQGDQLMRSGADREALLGARGAYREAIEIARGLMKRDAGHATLVLDLCEILEKAGHLELALSETAEAQRAWDECVALLRPLPGYGFRRRRLLGRVLIALSNIVREKSLRPGLLDEAVEALSEVSDEKHAHSRALVASGTAYDMQGNTVFAERRYATWLAQYQHDETLVATRAYLHGRIAQIQEDRKALEEAVLSWGRAVATLRLMKDATARLARALLAQAWLLETLGRSKSAMSLSEEVLRITAPEMSTKQRRDGGVFPFGPNLRSDPPKNGALDMYRGGASLLMALIAHGSKEYPQAAHWYRSAGDIYKFLSGYQPDEPCWYRNYVACLHASALLGWNGGAAGDLSYAARVSKEWLKALSDRADDADRMWDMLIQTHQLYLRQTVTLTWWDKLVQGDAQQPEPRTPKHTDQGVLGDYLADFHRLIRKRVDPLPRSARGALSSPAIGSE